MTTKITLSNFPCGVFAALLLAVSAGIIASVSADEPGLGLGFLQRGNVQTFVVANPAESEPCVLLRNGNVVYGAAKQHGEQVVVQRGDGSQIRLDRKQVLCWAESLQHLYQYRIDHRVGSSVQVHLSDARWCLRYGLLQQAVQEVEQLRRLDPTNPQCELLHRQVMGAIASASSVSQPTDQGTTDHPESKRFKSSVTIDDSPVALVDYESAALAVDPDRLHDFVSLVQPILVNRCGACHSHTSDQEWQLVTPARGVRTSARMARENYAATIRYIDFSAPESSVLLRYALTAHGGGEPGLGPRNALAAETLKRWMQSVTDHQSQASSFATETISSSPLPPLEPAAKEIAESVFPVDTKALKPVGEVSGSKNGLQRLPQVDNPFDPELFNRTFHSDAVSRRP